MGHYSIIPQAEARDSFGFTPPVSGLDYLNFFTGSGLLVRNLIAGGTTTVQRGSPEYLTGYTRFEGLTDGVQTGVTLAVGEAFSFCGVIKTPDAAPDTSVPVFFGTYNSGSPAAGIYMQARSNGIRGYVVADNGGAAFNMIEDLVVDETAWRFVAMTVDNRVSGTTTLRLIDKTANLTATETQAYDLMPTTRAVRIGQGHFASASGTADMAFAAIKAGMLTDAEITAIYERAKLSCALDGITI